MSKHIHLSKRRDFLKGAGCLVASGAASSFVPQLSLMGTALAGTISGYKAMVCLYLDGGNDSFNMLIPADNSTVVNVPGRSPLSGFMATPYGWYATSRGGHYAGNPSSLAIPLAGGGGTLLPNALPLTGGQFALNPAVADLQTLFNSGRLAFVANAGPIIFPMRRSNFNTIPRPPQLYSHNDQTSLWQIGAANDSSDPNGWGGKMAGQLVGVPPGSGLAPCISIAGQTRYLVGEYPGGQPVFPYRLSTSGTNPATSLTNYDGSVPAGGKRGEVLTGLLNETYPQAFSNEYGDILDRSRNLSAVVNAAIGGLTNPAPPAGTPRANFNTLVAGTSLPLNTPGFPPGLPITGIPNTGIGQQLRQVARMIAVSRFGQGTIQANRQVFFVRTGGYDTHDGQIPAAAPNGQGVWAGQQGLLQQISQAMIGFYNAMTALNLVAGYAGVVNEVVLQTMSEFSRTINSNGNGTDHAWGAVQMVMGAPQSSGGPLAGGQVYGRYPLQVLNRSYPSVPGTPDAFGECFNRGEFLPTTAVEQMSATFARWMGVSDIELPTIFPNIDNFVNPHVNSAVMAQNTRTMPFLNFT